MSETTPQAKGPAPVQLTPETTEPTLIPADQVKPEDVGTLSLRYADGTPELVVSGGTVIPAGLQVVDGSNNAVAAYSARIKYFEIELSNLLISDVTPSVQEGDVLSESVSLRTLSIEYRDGQPVIVVSGGKYIPAGLRVVDGSGNAIAAYTAASAAPLSPDGAVRRHAYDYGVIRLNADPLFEAEPGGAGGALGV